MLLRKWNELPSHMQCDEVRPYYDILEKKKGSLIAKRVFDVIAGSMLLVVLSGPMAIIAACIKADSKGPIFYRQERVTTYGKKFGIHKFRTMVNNADKIGTAVTVQGDSRITKVGHFLRKYRLDEFPQVFDVLSGNMSFVGTRPEATKYVEHYSSEMLATLLLPAGITSEASIKYKDEAEILSNAQNADETYINRILPEKMRWNLSSIKEFSFFKDIQIMIKTFIAVIK